MTTTAILDGRPAAACVRAEPYDFPLSGVLAAETTAFIVVDMQGDFCCADGLMDRQGVAFSEFSRPIPRIKALLDRCRSLGIFVCHTRETFLPDLSDVQPNRLWRGRGGGGTRIGDHGPNGRHLIAGEPCWEIVAELTPLPGEPVFDKPAYGAFGATGIGDVLLARGIRHLIVAGVTSDCCVHLTVQEALDRGFDCLTVEDATAASVPAAHDAMIRSIKAKGGVFGTAASTRAVLDALG